MKTLRLWLLNLTIVNALILIWWGASVTSKGVGMAVPDWPLAFDRINPEGWTRIPAIFLEHGHRWAGAFCGLWILLYALITWIQDGKKWYAFLLGIVIPLAFLGYLARENEFVYLIFGLLCYVIWFIHQGTIKQTRFAWWWAALALFLVVLQGFKGGIRVLANNDAWGVAHGFLAQIFFLYLIWVRWREKNQDRLEAIQPERSGWKNHGTLLLGMIVLQLLFGSLVRHHHRIGLAAADFWTTGGFVFPFNQADLNPELRMDLTLLWIHKWWGVLIWLVTLLYFLPRSWSAWKGLRLKLSWLMTLMIVAQFLLGIYVLNTGKNFWVTNFHVYNGLLVLTVSFICSMPKFWGSLQTPTPATLETAPDSQHSV